MFDSIVWFHTEGGGGGGGGTASAKREARDAQILTYSRPDSQTLAQVKVSEKERNKEGKESDSDSGRDSNPQPGIWPAML